MLLICILPPRAGGFFQVIWEGFQVVEKRKEEKRKRKEKREEIRKRGKEKNQWKEKKRGKMGSFSR